jgi:DNA-binding NarL/FixJ family response regulator
VTIAKPIRVLLVDDQTIVRQGLRSFLESYLNIEVVGEASDGEEALASVGKLQPAVVVMDVSMSRMDGITATRLIKAQYPHIAVVGLSDLGKDYEEYAMRKSGAFEVLNKDSAAVELFGAIQRAVAAVQPVLILEQTEQTPAPTQSLADLEQSEKPTPTEVLPIKDQEPKNEPKPPTS